MKNDPTINFLNFVLAALVILGVLFALLAIWRTHSLRHLQPQVQLEANQVQAVSVRAQGLLQDTVAYNATVRDPELAKIIQNAQAAAQTAR